MSLRMGILCIREWWWAVKRRRAPEVVAVGSSGEATFCAASLHTVHEDSTTKIKWRIDALQRPIVADRAIFRLKVMDVVSIYE